MNSAFLKEYIIGLENRAVEVNKDYIYLIALHSWTYSNNLVRMTKNHNPGSRWKN